MRGAFGIPVLLGIAWLLSENRRSIRLRPVLAGIGLQIALALLLLRVPLAGRLLGLMDRGADALQRATDAGSGFVFGYLGGGPPPFVATNPGAGFILAFRALPLVIVISALTALLFHWGVLQRVAQGFAWVLRRSMGLSGPLALGAAVHVFVGMIEAPLLIRPYLERMTRGEILALMSCGLAGVAGTVMVIYAGFLAPVLPNALGNILAASVISTPAALAVAAIMVPFGDDGTAGAASLAIEPGSVSALDAVVKGTMDGIGPLVGIIAMLLVAVTLVTLVNLVLGLLPGWGGAALTLQRIFAWPFHPVMWLIGLSWDEAGRAASLMGTKTVLNEFVAYRDLAGMPPAGFSPRARLIVTYALCGFANFGSLGILIGGLGAMIPERRGEIVALGLRAVLAGTLATCMSGALAGLLWRVG